MLLNLPCVVDTELSISSVVETSLSCTSVTGNETKVSPILYLFITLRLNGRLCKKDCVGDFTGFCHLHPPAQAHSRSLPGPPCLS